MNDEFIYITPLSVFGTVFVGTGALVSNNTITVFTIFKFLTRLVLGYFPSCLNIRVQH